MDGLTIGGLAQSAGVHVETVRYYERRGLLTPPDRRSRRRYSEGAVRRLALIRRAKALGFTLAEIGDLLDAAEGGSAQDVLAAAALKLAEVEADLRELQARRCRLARLVRACSAGADGCVTLDATTRDATTRDGAIRDGASPGGAVRDGAIRDGAIPESASPDRAVR